MKHVRLTGAVAIIIMLVLCFAASIVYASLHANPQKSSYADPLSAAPREEDPLAHIGEDFVVDEGFSSHLPIVILDTNGIDPPITTYSEGDRFVTIEGIEPYVSGKIMLLDNPDGSNTLSDTPTVVSDMIIKRRGNSSMHFAKAQWLVKLQTESGQDNEVDLLGMGADNEWILNGSLHDKSMLRNYLGFWLAAQTTLCAPDSTYCEVLIRNGDVYTYQGVYLLCENIKQGESRVPIKEYESTQTVNSYLIRRDRFEENVNTLENYARLQGYSEEFIELLYPSRHKATEEMTAFVENDINNIERILYSDNESVFSTYSDVIDVDSFVDYFIVNEFIGNYDAGNHSTYAFKDVGGKLTMGPVWDFDDAVDNYSMEVMNVEHLTFNTKPWFQQLCRDEAFVEALQLRYAELRRTVFSDISISEKISEIIQHLGGAQQREWARWNEWYTTETRLSLQMVPTDTDEFFDRNTEYYWDEISRIQSVLHDHGEEIPAQLQLLEGSCTWDTGVSSWKGVLLFLAAMLFLVPAYYISYRK